MSDQSWRETAALGPKQRPYVLRNIMMERLGHFLNKCIVVLKHTCNETWKKSNDYIEVICPVHRGSVGPGVEVG